MKKRISILGSTGSIGKQALEVVDCLQDKFEIVGLAAGSNLEEFKKQITKYNPEFVSVKTQELAQEIKKDIKNKEILWGNDGLVEIAKNTQNDIVLSAVTGLNGLFPVLAAIDNRINIALANKETLVAAGNIVMKKAKEKNVKILPVDSEHSAIFQCLASRDFSNAKKLIITGSGGPFRNKSLEEIQKATVEETLAHPNWSMGDKITVDSATLMNKGLEVLEAHRLFGFSPDMIDVLIHPQSIIHSMIELKDRSCIVQLSVPDMKGPIAYALTYPERLDGPMPFLDLSAVGKLTFQKPNTECFPCLLYAYEAMKIGGTMLAVLNAANEVAVAAFLQREIGFNDIPVVIKNTMQLHEKKSAVDIDVIVEADRWAREKAREVIKKIKI